MQKPINTKALMTAQEYRKKSCTESRETGRNISFRMNLPVQKSFLDNPIAMGNLRDEESEIEQLEKQGQSIQESEDLKSYRIYERGLVALMKARDDFKKYGGEELLRKLKEQKAKGK